MDFRCWQQLLGKITLRELRLGKNSAHHVVEVMRDATSQRSESFQLLFGERLLLNPFEVRDVDGRADVPGERAAWRKPRSSVIQHPPELSICTTEAILHLKFLAGFK